MAEWDTGGRAYMAGSGLLSKYVSNSVNMSNFMFGSSAMHREPRKGLLSTTISSSGLKNFRIRSIREYTGKYLRFSTSNVRYGRASAGETSYSHRNYPKPPTTPKLSSYSYVRRTYSSSGGSASSTGGYWYQYQGLWYYNKDWRNINGKMTYIGTPQKTNPTGGGGGGVGTSYSLAKATSVGSGGAASGGYWYHYQGLWYYNKNWSNVGGKWVYNGVGLKSPPQGANLKKTSSTSHGGGSGAGSWVFQRYLANIPREASPRSLRYTDAGIFIDQGAELNVRVPRDMGGVPSFPDFKMTYPQQEIPRWAESIQAQGSMAWMVGLGPVYLQSIFARAYRAGAFGVTPGEFYQYHNAIQTMYEGAESARSYSNFLAYMARASYYESQQALTPQFEMWETAKLATYVFKELTPIRALGFPFYGAMEILQRGAAQGPWVNRLYQVDPQYTRALIETS